MEHFKEAIADILNRAVEFPRGAFVTVVNAELTSDLRFAKTVLSVLPVTAEEDVLEALRDYHGEIMDEMAKTLNLRRLPKLHWEFDRTEHEAAKIESVIDEMKADGEL